MLAEQFFFVASISIFEGEFVLYYWEYETLFELS